MTQQPASFLISFRQSRFAINDKQQYTTEKVSQTDADVSMQEVESPLCLKVEVGAGCCWKQVWLSCWVDSDEDAEMKQLKVPKKVSEDYY